MPLHLTFNRTVAQESLLVLNPYYHKSPFPRSFRVRQSQSTTTTFIRICSQPGLCLNRVPRDGSFRNDNPALSLFLVMASVGMRLPRLLSLLQQGTVLFLLQDTTLTSQLVSLFILSVRRRVALLVCSNGIPRVWHASPFFSLP